MKELAALAYHNSINENREFWKHEMGQALREIQEVYDEKIDSMRGELETFYNLKVIKIGSFMSTVSITSLIA
jgi:intermediate filament protein if